MRTNYASRTSLTSSRLTSSRRNRRGGFTLLELVVVLVILAALAGMLIPLLPNMTLKTHGASGANNMQEIAKFVQTHQVLNNSMPTGWDSLIDTAGDIVIETAAAGQLETVPDLTAGDGPAIAAALADVGITGSWTHIVDAPEPTFAPYSTPLGGLITLQGPYDNDFEGPVGGVVRLSVTGEAELNLEPSIVNGGTYIVAYAVLGLGTRSTMVGKSLTDAPIHFPEEGTPNDAYNRFMVVFAIPADGPARMTAVIAAHDEGLSGIGGHLEEYYEAE